MTFLYIFYAVNKLKNYFKIMLLKNYFNFNIINITFVRFNINGEIYVEIISFIEMTSNSYSRCVFLFKNKKRQKI